MALIPGVYEIEKNENFVEYLIAYGVPEENAKKLDLSKSKLTFKVNGDKYTIISEPGRVKERTFASGEKFEDGTFNGAQLTSVVTVSGNKINMTTSTGDGKTGDRVYGFSDDGVVITYTTPTSNVVGKQIYKRV